MLEYAKPLANLIDELKQLPGIGAKSAQRIAFHLLKSEAEEVVRLSDAIQHLKENLNLCEICGNITDVNPCNYCSDPARDVKLICVVEEPANISTIENTGRYRGTYHVLHGVLSPLQGVSPEHLRIGGLLDRINKSDFEEVILATNSTAEGEATAFYLAKLMKPLGVRITRIATGIPVGSELDYVDTATISRALEGRREF